MAAEQDSVPAGRIAVFGFAGIVLTYVIVLLVQGLYFAGQHQEWVDKVVEVPNTKADSVIAAQQASNRSYGVVDSEAGTYQIPVERAMELVLEEQADD